MYGVITTFKFKKPLTQEQIDIITETAIEPMTHEPGFRHYFVIGDEAGKVGSFHAWDSQKQAEMAVANMMPKLQPLIGEILEEAPVRIMSELIAEFH